ncbi:MAG: hypothetical protein QW547_04110 [Candidatus Bathyarchaeia archaeon]
MSDAQSARVINYYRKVAEDYDKEYDAPYFKMLYDKITRRYIELYLLRGARFRRGRRNE